MPRGKPSSTKVETKINVGAINAFKKEFQGEIIRPGDSTYNQARKVWNAMIDKYPAIIARCNNVEDVQAAVRFARRNDLLASVRGGGHGVGGFAVNDGGIVIDLSLMKYIDIDTERRIVRAQAGLNWGQFARQNESYNLATTGSIVSDTGIAGLTLGGGLGWLMRKYGLACDNLASAEVVTAEGGTLIADEKENPDLFWALRGGGGNFGIVTTLIFKLHPIGPVQAGMVLHPIEQAAELFRFYRDYVTTIPDELTTMAAMMTVPDLPILPKGLHGKPVAALMMCYVGTDGASAIKGIENLRRFGSPLIDLIQTMPYTTWQSMLDATLPPGKLNYWKSEYLSGLDDAGIDTMVNYFASVPSRMTQMHIHHMQGAIARIPEDATAFSHRDSPFAFNIISMWDNPGETDKNVQWTRQFDTAMKPHATGGVNLNFLGDEGEERVRAAFTPENFERLKAIKKKYDPFNFFRMNHNINPGR